MQHSEPASRLPRAGGLPLPPAIGLALGLLLAVALAALWFQDVAREAVRGRAHTHQVRLELTELRNEVLELSRAVRGYVATGREDWLEPGREAQRQAPRRLQRLRQLSERHPAQQQRLAALERHLQALIELDEAVLRAAVVQGLPAARQRIAASTGPAELAAMSGLFDALDAEELRLLGERDAAVQRNTNLTIAVTALGSLLSLALVAWAGWGQQRSLRRLGDTVRALEQAQASLSQANTRLQAQAGQTAELNEALWRSIGDGVARPSAQPSPQRLDAPERLEALRRTQLMDTPPEEDFDRFTRLAALTLQAPLCLISLVDDRRQFFKSAFGLPEALAGSRELPVQESFCQFVVTSGEALVVEDARHAPPPRYALPVPEGVVAYLGVPLATPDGHVLGSFCVVDDKPRQWTALERIAQSVLAAVAVRMQLRALEKHVAVRTAEVQLLAGALKHSLNGVSIVDRRGYITYANDAFSLQFGYERPEEVVGQPVELHCTQPGQAQRIYEELRAWGACRTELTARRRDGSPLEVLVDVYLARDEGGHEVYVGTTMDITERKRAEQALRLGEERLRLALEAARMGAYDHDPATGEVQRIGTLYVSLGLAPRGHGEEYLDRVHPEDRAMLRSRMAGVSPAQPGYTAEYRLRTAAGGWAWTADHAQASFSDAGELQRQIGINMDITARREAEAGLKAALAEKEVLLQEVHHRVKNNLQVVSSLLQLQRRQLRDPAIEAVFSETEHRVRAMALVHQRLYQQSTLSALNFADYLRTLADQLIRSFGAEGRVRPACELQPLTLPVNTAIPLGLIVTELITNALKYAYGPGSEGVLGLVLRMPEAEPAAPRSVVLEVHDSGPGLPPGFEPAGATSLGMRLVTLLSRQLDALVEIGPGPGTHWRVTVPLGAPGNAAAGSGAAPAAVAA
ncbi:histidine kinase dimerization/phosphoacceptor domain -containing protein [Azohydromonas australica]|uniref:histidine kinase dimerization/phosphoacceptor domain -containing protein n=1 Tax=Azohydromonas australica TaxID=364039 RepID=UPI000404779F|nr:histidine kinase dimerization/phosphoacceptor domain -containing protein [Azohydromonas australica]